MVYLNNIVLSLRKNILMKMTQSDTTHLNMETQVKKS